jgi:hypothetical protein
MPVCVGIFTGCPNLLIRDSNPMKLEKLTLNNFDDFEDLLSVIEGKKKQLCDLFLVKQDLLDHEIYKTSCELDRLILKAQRRGVYVQCIQSPEK